MALYRNKVLVSGIRDYPAMTWADYQALPVAQRPKKWICTDRDYTAIPGDTLADLTGLNVADNTAYVISALTTTALKDYEYIDVFVLTSDYGTLYKSFRVPLDNKDVLMTQILSMSLSGGVLYGLGMYIRINSAGTAIRYDLTNYSNRHINAIKIIGYK